MNDKSNSQAYSFKLPVLEPIMSTLFWEKTVRSDMRKGCGSKPFTSW